MTTIKSTRTPLWSRLAQTLAGDILSGRLPVGSLLPTEAQLMNDYGMSRHTVRSALAELVHLGLIRRSPRRGTIVTGDGRGAEFTASLVPSLPADAYLLSYYYLYWRFSPCVRLWSLPLSSYKIIP